MHPFPADLGEVDLIKQYGSANVKRAPVTGSDDGPQDGTVVFDDTPRRLDIVWWDSRGEKQACLGQVPRAEQSLANPERHFHWDGFTGHRTAQWLALPT